MDGETVKYFPHNQTIIC